MLDGLSALARGFWTTLRHAGQPPTTFGYPEVKRPLPPTFRVYPYPGKRIIG